MDTWIVVLGAIGIGQTLMLLVVAAGESPRPPALIWLSPFLVSIGATLAADDTTDCSPYLLRFIFTHRSSLQFRCQGLSR